MNVGTTHEIPSHLESLSGPARAYRNATILRETIKPLIDACFWDLLPPGFISTDVRRTWITRTVLPISCELVRQCLVFAKTHLSVIATSLNTQLYLRSLDSYPRQVTIYDCAKSPRLGYNYVLMLRAPRAFICTYKTTHNSKSTNYNTLSTNVCFEYNK